MVIPVLLGITIIIFTLLYLAPGDPAKIILGDAATQEALQQVSAKLGLDQPYIVRLFKYISNILQGDFGISYKSMQPVLGEIIMRIPQTLKLATLSVILAIVIGITTGIISAIRQYSWLDNVATAFGLFGVSIPVFWWALMLILVFSVNLRWLPSSGGGAKWTTWILPCIALGWNSAAIIMRMTRSSMMDVMRQDYIRTARAKGQAEWIVVGRHILGNSLIPIITVAGLQYGALLGGAIVVESIFSISGIGKYLLDSITYRNYPAVQGAVLFTSALFAMVNLLVDILYALIDPRIKSLYSRKKKAQEDE
jgi:peptide/nickel transport system permease protein